MTKPTKYLTTAEAAAELRINPETVRRWIGSGRLPALNIGGTNYRIDRADWQAFVSDLRVSTPLTKAGA